MRPRPVRDDHHAGRGPDHPDAPSGDAAAVRLRRRPRRPAAHGQQPLCRHFAPLPRRGHRSAVRQAAAGRWTPAAKAAWIDWSGAHHPAGPPRIPKQAATATQVLPAVTTVLLAAEPPAELRARPASRPAALPLLATLPRQVHPRHRPSSWRLLASLLPDAPTGRAWVQVPAVVPAVAWARLPGPHRGSRPDWPRDRSVQT